MPQTQSILTLVVAVDPKVKCFILTFLRYFTGSEGYVKHQYTFWHGQHAEFFEGSEDYDRKSEVGSKNIYQILPTCFRIDSLVRRIQSTPFMADTVGTSS